MGKLDMTPEELAELRRMEQEPHSHLPKESRVSKAIDAALLAVPDPKCIGRVVKFGVDARGDASIDITLHLEAPVVGTWRHWRDVEPLELAIREHVWATEPDVLLRVSFQAPDRQASPPTPISPRPPISPRAIEFAQEFLSKTSTTRLAHRTVRLRELASALEQYAAEVASVATTALSSSDSLRRRECERLLREVLEFDRRLESDPHPIGSGDWRQLTAAIRAELGDAPPVRF